MKIFFGKFELIMINHVEILEIDDLADFKIG